MKNHDDWRLPTIQELSTLIDYTVSAPACVIKESQKIDSYWSATEYAGNMDAAWVVLFYDGYTDYSNKSNNHAVRCVRTSSEKKLHWSKISAEPMNWNNAMKYANNLIAPTQYKS